MPLSLLTTKLFFPPARRDFVPRSLLVERLNVGLERKLVLVSAPAGFGKTTLLSSWISQGEIPAAWVSLDEGDNDPVRFLTYFIAALQTIEAGIGETPMAMLHASQPQPPPIESILTALINEIAETPRGFILVLDDYHFIHTPSIHQQLVFLLEHQPPQMHLVIATRSDPFFLPLSRLRARGQMIDIRADDLRFLSQETTTFLNQVMGLGLSDDQVATLENRTEGWIAGLHLAALSMQGRKQSGEDASSFISAFRGDDRYIGDYLIDEVLSQRPQGTKDFLLQTSILDRMTGSLCDAVTGQESGEKVLRGLEQANLFVVPLDNRRRWYRYHHLFADLLRQRLKESTPAQEMKSLHRRASQWYKEHDFLVEAVEHTLAAEDFEDVIRLVELGSMKILMQSQQSLLLKWQAELPQELVASHPRFCLTIAWAWLSMGHPQEAENCLQLLEQSLGTEMVEICSEPDRAAKIDPAIESVLVEIAVLRMELAIRRGNMPQVFELARLVLPYLEDKEGSPLDDLQKDLRSVVFFVLGLAYKISGKLGEADEALSEAAVLGRERGNVHIVAGSVGRLANVQSMQGHPSQAVSTCQRGLELVQEMVGERSPVSGLIHAELGNLLYEQNDLKAALYHLQEGIDLARPWGFVEALVPGYTGLARVRTAQGDIGGASAALDELEALGQSNPQTVMPAVESCRASLWLVQGEVDRARRWAESTGLDTDSEIGPFCENERVILARGLMAQKEWDKATRLIGRLLDATETSKRWQCVIELLALQALVLDAQGKQDEALDVLARALALAEPEGYVRTFIDEGEPMAVLLRRAASRGIAPTYTCKLLAAFEPDTLSGQPPVTTLLIEPLSEREIEVLRLLNTELSGPEIARELTIALPTLRFHTRNIYGKLGVHNRIQAVTRAEEMGLL
jgi:LuxR family maltose regulon positive regulatory protein